MALYGLHGNIAQHITKGSEVTKVRVIMTGGGTGGHIYPAIAIAEKIKEKNAEAEILFVGTSKGLEKDLVPKNGYNIKFITVSGFNRKNPLKNIRFIKDLSKGNSEAKKIIRDFKPDIVIGTGGYVCGPVVRAAHKMGIKTFVHEQNAFPGMTNKLLEKHVDKVFISFEAARQYFKKPEKLVFSGNPVRKAFFEADREENRKKLNLNSDDFAVLCFGGSRGAGKINQVMQELLEPLGDCTNLKLFFVTGKIYYNQIVEDMKKTDNRGKEDIHILEYIDNMDCYLSAADLVISRSGALTVSEITVLGKPSILIPSPNVTGNHQFFNAKAVADVGGATIIEEKDLTRDALLKEILRMKDNKKLTENMGKAAKSVAPENATNIIYNHLI